MEKLQKGDVPGSGGLEDWNEGSGHYPGEMAQANSLCLFVAGLCCFNFLIMTDCVAGFSKPSQ